MFDHELLATVLHVVVNMIYEGFAVDFVFMERELFPAQAKEG